VVATGGGAWEGAVESGRSSMIGMEGGCGAGAPEAGWAAGPGAPPSSAITCHSLAAITGCGMPGMPFSAIMTALWGLALVGAGGRSDAKGSGNGGSSTAGRASSSKVSRAAEGLSDLIGLSISASVSIFRILSPTVIVLNSIIRNPPMTMVTKVAAATMGPLNSIVYAKTHSNSMNAIIRMMIPRRPPRRR
jgi:hypothetical protein